MDPVVIIGTGLAGYSVAREFRKLDSHTPLIVVSADDGGFYSKPMLSNALAQGKTANDLLVAPAERMASELNADIRTGTRVSALDSVTKRLTLNHEELGYGRLVLALGADPIRLELNGDAAGKVLSINDRTDYALFRERIAHKRRIVVLGGGLIGCEFANDLTSAGYQVAVVDIASHPLGRLVPPEVGNVMRHALAASGVEWHLGMSVTAVENAGDALNVVLSDGSTLTGDVVLSAIGLRPRTGLATAAGLKVTRGIVADRFLETSARDVYALGDCAEIEGLVLPFVVPLMHSARALAKTLAGFPTTLSLPVMPVIVKTPACPLVIAPPSAGTEGCWDSMGAGTNVRGLFFGTNGELLGFALTGSACEEKHSLIKGVPPMLS